MFNIHDSATEAVFKGHSAQETLAENGLVVAVVLVVVVVWYIVLCVCSLHIRT